MSLVGNLEDLGLGEILQIVSLSRKSGVLTLQCDAREGKIFFHEGQVMRANINSQRENLAEVLVDRGVAPVEALVQAGQAAQSEGLSLGEVLARDHDIAREQVEEVVRGLVEEIVYGFFAWDRGTFSFALGEPTDLGEPPEHPFHFVFPSGLNPQWLAMEGSRILDEKRHRGEPIEDPGDLAPPVPELQQLMGEEGPASPPVPPPTAVTAPASGSVGSAAPLFLIDDDDFTREQLAEALVDQGFVVRSFSEPQRFLEAVAESCAGGREPAALIDLIMPRADGSGILGGLELLEQLRQQHPALMVLMVTDHPNPDALQKARALDVAGVLSKPKKNEVRRPEGEAALRELAERIAERLHLEEVAPEAAFEPAHETASAATSASSGFFNLGVEMSRELGGNDPDFVPAKGPQSPGLHLLRGMLGELQNPALGGGIILLVLRFASELMNRAVIFVVKEREIVGLGQFGIDSSEGPADVRVRKMSIPRGAGSVFDRVTEEMAAQRVQLGDGEWDTYLRDQLGGDPVEVFLGPIISEGKVVAVLYGDNFPEQLPVGDTEALEIFLSQAGIAMEKALLERRLRGRDEG